jgi:predicted secreted protein
MQRGILAMKSLLMASLIIGLTVQSPRSAADWWSDNDDNADVQDIDAGAASKPSADDDLGRNAVGLRTARE